MKRIWLGRSLLGSVITAVIVGGLMSVPAEAAPPLFNHFAPTGSAAGQSLAARGVATDVATGHVIFADRINARVDEFTPWGSFVRSFGWDVAPEAVNEEQEVRVKAAEGQFKLRFKSQATSDLAHTATAGEVEAALNALPSVSGLGSVSVSESVGTTSGTSPYVYVVSFGGGSLKHSDVSQIEAEDGTVPLVGGTPSKQLLVRTRANGTVGGTGLESCTAASKCKAGTEGAGTGQLGAAQGVAVDSNGFIYVGDRLNNRVEKFNSSGEFVLMFGGEVNKTKSEELGSTEAERNLCPVDPGDECQAGITGVGQGQFSEWPISSLVSVGPSDTVYVGDKGRIQKFNPAGHYLGEITLTGDWAGERVSSLAVAASGNLWLAVANPIDSKPAKPNVRQFDPTGTTQVCEEIEVARPTALGAKADGGVYVFADSATGTPESNTSEIREYDSDCEAVAEPFGVHVFETSTGIGTNPTGDVYVSNAGGFNGTNTFVNAYGPPPLEYESPEPVAPEILAEHVTSVGATVATVGAEINPHLWADTAYYVQYGPEDCIEAEGWEAFCVGETPVPPGALLTSSPVDVAVATEEVALSGLAPDTRYSYRFVAASSGGGPSLGESRSFFTYQGQSGPGDGRVYEKSSPEQKLGGEVGVPTPAGGGAESSVQPQQAAAQGGAVSYASATAFTDPKSAPAASQYFSRALGGGLWSTENLDPRYEEGFLRQPVVGLSPDLSHAALFVPEPILSSEAPAGFANLYWRDNGDGSLQTLATRVPKISVPKADYCLTYGGSSADGGRVFFQAKGALIEGDPVTNGFNLYEWAAGRPAGEELRLVSVLPDGSKATPDLNTSYGDRGIQAGGCWPEQTLMRHAISADGEKAFWNYAGNFEGAQKPLLARVGGSETIQVDKPQGLSGAGGKAQYWDASLDGSKVFFTDTEKLTTQPTTPGSSDLYLYDFSQTPGEELTNLTAKVGEAASVGGVLGVSPDGETAYFVAKGVLDDEEGPRGEIAEAGKFNLYAWRVEAGMRFVAQLSSEDGRDWTVRPDLQTSRIAASGAVTFLSSRSLTGFDNHVAGGAGCILGASGLVGSPDCAEVFLYDYDADVLTCASCTPSGARPTGPALLSTWNTPYEQPRYLSANGGRVFFETFSSLDPHDQNEKRDVYEYERSGQGSCTAAKANPDGYCLYLVSDGKSSDESYFVDASADGNDVFFSTRSQLLFTDADLRYDVYDARVGGALPPTPPLPPCEGEGCRGEATHPGAYTPPSTPAFAGPPNPKPPPPPCPKGKHRVKRHGKSRCVAKQGGNQRQTTNKQRANRRKQHQGGQGK